mgnify:CR=1 FL=1
MPGQARYIGNAFSLSMIKPPVTVRIEEITAKEFCQEAANSVSAIGHIATAELVSRLCGINIPANRINITLNKGDILFIVQLMIRLEEGRILNTEELETLLNEGKIKFMKVIVE